MSDQSQELEQSGQDLDNDGWSDARLVLRR